MTYCVVGTPLTAERRHSTFTKTTVKAYFLLFKIISNLFYCPSYASKERTWKQSVKDFKIMSIRELDESSVHGKPMLDILSLKYVWNIFIRSLVVLEPPGNIEIFV